MRDIPIMAPVKRRMVIAVIAAAILITMAWPTLLSRFTWDFRLLQSGPLPTAQWRFLDADTGKPLEGVWVNFAWTVPMKERRGMRTCIRAVLAQSDAEGYVRDTAGGRDWELDSLWRRFKPGYEGMDYEFRKGDLEAGMVTAKVNQDQNQRGNFPPWERKLEELGFVWQQPEWTKRLKLPERPGREGEKNVKFTRYMYTYRSMPYVVSSEFQPVGRICDQPNAENIGLDLQRVALADRERGLASTRYLCRADWDEIPDGRQPDMFLWLIRTFWILNRPELGGGALVQREQPTVWAVYENSFGAPRFTPDLRKAYCAWLEEKTGVDLDGH